MEQLFTIIKLIVILNVILLGKRGRGVVLDRRSNSMYIVVTGDLLQISWVIRIGLKHVS